MAPSLPINTAARKPSRLTVITDAIHKKESEMPIRARQILAQTVTHAWTIELDEDSVERPESPCELSGDDLDLDNACRSDEGCAAADATLVLAHDDAVASVWNEASECTDESGEMLPLLGVHVAFSSDFKDDAVGVWAAPQGESF